MPLKNKEAGREYQRQKYARERLNPEFMARQREYSRQYHARHRLDPDYRGNARQRAKEWAIENPDRANASSRAWAKRNPERRGKIKAKSLKKRYHENPHLRVLMCLRSRLFIGLRGITKSDRTMGLLGCTIPELRAHLEKQFTPGMTWENYGPIWHIDHIRPCASFDLTDPAQQRICFNWSNLQPLFAEENLKKGDKWPAS